MSSQNKMEEEKGVTVESDVPDTYDSPGKRAESYQLTSPE
jgi:hypothetical protein